VYVLHVHLSCGALRVGGQYQGRIRSLCQFYNATDLVLEVALLQDDDTSWTLLPTSASSSSSRPGGPGNVGDVVEEEVFEYERYLPLRGWSASHLSALDPRQFSRFRNGSNGTSSFPRVPLAPVSVQGVRSRVTR
jgi:vacuolar protein sorting-associated protein 13A/C